MRLPTEAGPGRGPAGCDSLVVPRKPRTSPFRSAIGIRSGILVAITAAIAAGAALLGASCRAADSPSPPPVVRSPEPVIEAPPAPKGLTVLPGPPPEFEGYRDGAPAAFVRWSDERGEFVAVLSVATVSERPDRADEAGVAWAVIEARLYGVGADGYEPVAERVETAASGARLPEIRPYKDGAWVVDSEGDGRGAAIFAYSVDYDDAPGPLRLALFELSPAGHRSVTGWTRYDPADRPRSAPVTVVDARMASAPETALAEALSIWNDAQFDLAEPPAFPGFYSWRRFADAVLRSDDPFWTLTILPSFALLKFSGEAAATVIRYDSLRAEGASLIIEGKGEAEAWTHGFRVTVTEEPVKDPHGAEHPLRAVVDWSDGTRLSGWGNLAE